MIQNNFFQLSKIYSSKRNEVTIKAPANKDTFKLPTSKANNHFDIIFNPDGDRSFYFIDQVDSSSNEVGKLSGFT